MPLLYMVLREMEKINLKEIHKQYAPADQCKDAITSSRAEVKTMPQVHRSVNTPTASELKSPPVALGEGSLYDVTPYLTVQDLPRDWLELMQGEASKGRGLSSIMRVLGITKRGLETLQATSPEFREGLERCLILSQEWWEERGRDMTLGGKGNGSVWLANMVNKWGWNSNKQETSAYMESSSKVSVNKELSKEELDEELEKRGLSLALIEETNETK